MVGKTKHEFGLNTKYKCIISNENVCSSGVSCGGAEVGRKSHAGLWAERKEKKETYEVVLANGQTMTRKYTPYKSKWKQRKDARRKNKYEFLNKEQTEGVEFINDNGIKIYKRGHYDHEKWEPTETVEDEWVQRTYGEGKSQTKIEGLMSKRGKYHYDYVAPLEPVKKKIKLQEV